MSNRTVEVTDEVTPVEELSNQVGAHGSDVVTVWLSSNTKTYSWFRAQRVGTDCHLKLLSV